MAFAQAPDLNKIFSKPLNFEEALVWYEGNTEVTDVLNTIITDLKALITSGHVADGEADPVITEFAARPTVDGKCLGAGFISKEKVTRNPADVDIKVLCDGCGAWGQTTDTNVPYQDWTLYEAPKTEA